MYILKPSFYDQFQCTANECNFTCCQGWQIYLEKNIYEKYEEYQNILKGIEEEHIISENDFFVYKMPLLKNGMCPFCTKKQLCSMVMKHGPEALGYVCAVFPRTSVITNETEELFLSYGCSQVVELLMNIEEPLTFILEEDEREGIDKSRMSRREREEEDRLCARIDFDVQLRDRMIDWLQDREYPLWFRQFICVYSLDKVKEMHYRDEREETFLQLEKILSPAYLQQFFQGLNVIDTDKRRKFLQLQQLFEAFTKKYENTVGEDRDNSKKNTEELININSNCTFEQYIEAEERWQNEKASTFDILAEHLTVYDWYGCALEAVEQYYFLENSLFIMLEQLLIKYSMILYYSKYKNLDRNMQKFIISLLSRIIDHGRKPLKKTIINMGENMLSIDNIFLLLK